MFRFDFESAILAALKNGPAHGYLVMSRITEATEGSVKITVGQLYPTLHRLEESGFVKSAWEAQFGKPDRRTYELTPAGKKRLKSRVSEWKKFSQSVNRLFEGPKKAIVLPVMVDPTQLANRDLESVEAIS